MGSSQGRKTKVLLPTTEEKVTTDTTTITGLTTPEQITTATRKIMSRLYVLEGNVYSDSDDDEACCQICSLPVTEKYKITCQQAAALPVTHLCTCKRRTSCEPANCLPTTSKLRANKLWPGVPHMCAHASNTQAVSQPITCQLHENNLATNCGLACHTCLAA